MKKLFFILLITLPLFGQWTPAQLDSVLLWIRTDAVTLDTDPDSHIVAWTNKAGGTSDLVVSAADTAILQTGTTFRGRAAAKFSGTISAYYDFNPDSVLHGLGSSRGDEFTMAFIASPNAARSEVIAGQKNSPNVHFGFVSGISAIEIQYLQSTVRLARGSTSLVTDTVYIVFATHGQTADSMWVNNVAETVSYRAGSFGNAPGTGAGDYYTLGSYLQGTGREFTGRIYEYLYISKALTAAERDSLYSYMNNLVPTEVVSTERNRIGRFGRRYNGYTDY